MSSERASTDLGRWGRRTGRKTEEGGERARLALKSREIKDDDGSVFHEIPTPSQSPSGCKSLLSARSDHERACRSDRVVAIISALCEVNRYKHDGVAFGELCSIKIVKLMNQVLNGSLPSLPAPLVAAECIIKLDGDLSPTEPANRRNDFLRALHAILSPFHNILFIAKCESKTHRSWQEKS